MSTLDLDSIDDLLALDPRGLSEWLRSIGRFDRPAFLAELDWALRNKNAFEAAAKARRRELPTGIDPQDLSRTGWGVIFPKVGSGDLRRRLGPLLEHRTRQAGKMFREFWRNPNELARDFLWYRHGDNPGTIAPNRMPYYLLIVGSPEDIPFEFQYTLSINHAVGRIYFDDVNGYDAYAANVVGAETRGGGELPRRTDIVSVKNGQDAATALLEKYLVEPLKKDLGPYYAGWEIVVRAGEEARKRQLLRQLNGDGTPGLLLVACHGKRCMPGSERQEEIQGALICQDWAGPGFGAITREHYLQFSDLAAGGRVQGLIALLFACFSAGTPLEDNFPHESQWASASEKLSPEALALRPFVARLPQALLRRGALAVLGHVDRGWTLSFAWESKGKTHLAVESLKDSLRRLLAGHRLGHALRPLYRRYAALAAHLAQPVEKLRNDERVDDKELGKLWTAHNDARNFIILGDPAVYLLGRRGDGRRGVTAVSASDVCRGITRRDRSGPTP